MSLFKLNLLGCHWFTEAYRFQVYNSVIAHRHRQEYNDSQTGKGQEGGRKCVEARWKWGKKLEKGTGSFL